MENNSVIMETASSLRARGRAALAGHWKEAVLAVLVYQVIISLVPSLIDAFLGWEYAMPGLDGTETIYGSPSFLYLLAVSGPMSLGIVIFFINLFRHQETDVASVMKGFEKFGKAFVLALLIAIFIILWSLLLIVPGIIAAFRYSQAFYLMNDHPELSAMDCIRESKRLMAGNKGKLFVTVLSFIGWAILAVLPGSVFAGFFLEEGLLYTPAGAVAAVGSFILGAGLLWVTAYVYATTTAFYELLKGNITGQVFNPGQY